MPLHRLFLLGMPSFSQANLCCSFYTQIQTLEIYPHYCVPATDVIEVSHGLQNVPGHQERLRQKDEELSQSALTWNAVEGCPGMWHFPCPINIYYYCDFSL